MAQRLGWGREETPVDVEPAPLGTGSPSPARRIAILIGVLAIAAMGLAYAYDRAGADHFYPGTRIGGATVGSLTAEEAEAVLHERYVVPLRKHVTLRAPEFKKKSTPWKMGMRVEVSDAARDALVRQQSEPIFVRLWHRATGDGTNVRIRPTVDDEVFEKFLRKTYKKINQDPQDARLDVSRDELEVIPHKLGRKVDKKAAEAAVFAALTARDKEVEIPAKVVQPELRTEAFKRVILISTGSNRLVLYKNGKVAKKYGVATGTGGYPTPHGQFRITAKRMNPTWYNPNSDWSRGMPAFIPPGPNNPLGTRALNLNVSGIRIHGTPDAGSIGTNASHGCIRMRMHEAEDLFDRVEVGTPVLIVS